MSSMLVLPVERAFPTDLPEHYIGLTFPQRCVLSWGSPFDANCVSYRRLTDKTIFIVAVISMDLSIFSPRSIGAAYACRAATDVRAGQFFIHGRGRHGSDGCIVPLLEL